MLIAATCSLHLGLDLQASSGGLCEGVSGQPHNENVTFAGDYFSRYHHHAGTASGRGWSFPQKGYEQEETIRQAAESALNQALAESETRQVYFVGNSPAGHREQGDAMTFYHRAQLIKGDIALRRGTANSDYVWVTKSELPEYLEDEVELKLFELILSQ